MCLKTKSFLKQICSVNPDHFTCYVQHCSLSGLKVIKLFSSSTLMSIKFILLINVKMPTIVGILTFMSRRNTPESFEVGKIFSFYKHLKFHARVS